MDVYQFWRSVILSYSEVMKILQLTIFIDTYLVDGEIKEGGVGKRRTTSHTFTFVCSLVQDGLC